MAEIVPLTGPAKPSLPASLKRHVSLPEKALFDANGEFVGTVEDGNWEAAPVPADQLPELRNALQAFNRYLAPAPRKLVVSEVATLLSHYFIPDLPTGLQTAVADDWIEDLGEFPAHVVNEACRRWRRMEGRRPKPVDIRDICQRLVAKDKRDRERIRKLIEVSEHG